jgi:hypothetical protein
MKIFEPKPPPTSGAITRIAAAVSMLLIRACACGERRNTA